MSVRLFDLIPQAIISGFQGDLLMGSRSKAQAVEVVVPMRQGRIMNYFAAHKRRDHRARYTGPVVQSV